MADKTLTPEIRSILERSTTDGDLLRLPPDRLDPKTYKRVNEVIELGGGKWNRSKQAHVFTTTAEDARTALLGVEKIIDQKKKYQAFFTPSALASRLVEIAQVNGATVLEPSAGEGALVGECHAQGAARVSCIELKPEHAAVLRTGGNEVIEGDFLGVKPEPQFDRVVMNPPFSKNQDVAHVRHALRWLKTPGRLVAIMAGNTDRKPFTQLENELSAGAGITYRIEQVEAGEFKESGTNVATIILVVDKE